MPQATSRNGWQRCPREKWRYSQSVHGPPNRLALHPSVVYRMQYTRSRKMSENVNLDVQGGARLPLPLVCKTSSGVRVRVSRGCPAREGFRAEMTIERGETGRVDSSGNIWCLVVQAQLPAFLLQSRARQASRKQADAGQQCDRLETANCNRYSNG